MTPVLPLLIAWLAICSVGVAAGVSPDLLRTASQSALVPTWFLAAYVLVVAVAPVTLALWERYGWWSFFGGMAVAAVVDLVSISTGSILVGFLNYLFVWASVHQLGYAWRDGALDGARRRLALSALGLAAVSALVWVGPYPVGMVGTGQPVENSYPARVTLLFLGMFQIGLALLAERRLQAWLQRPAAWRATIAVNARIMTLYLWHMTAMLGLVGLSLTLGGRGLHLEPATGAWWATRPVWFAVCGVVTVALIAVFGRLEDPSIDLRPAPRVWRPVVATVAVCGGLAVMAKSGIVSADGCTGSGRCCRSRPCSCCGWCRCARSRRGPDPGAPRRPQGVVGRWPKVCRRTQACMAMAAAAPAFIDRVEPNWLISSTTSQAASISGEMPGPSCPRTRTQSRGRSWVSIGTEPGTLSMPTTRRGVPPSPAVAAHCAKAVTSGWWCSTW